jgi:phage tail-like protein
LAATDGRDGRNQAATALLATQGRRYFNTTATSRLPATRNGAGPDGVPENAQLRRYLRNGLPAIYHDGDFGLRFIEGLEAVLDPIVALLDCLHAYISPEIAPRDMVQLMAAWLGVELDEAWPEERWRELVLNASQLARMRGTKAGLELELSVAFPGVPLRVEDEGGVYAAQDESQLPPVKEPGFVVYCETPLSEADAAALARSIENMKPVHVNYRLRIKAPKKTAAT